MFNPLHPRKSALLLACLGLLLSTLLAPAATTAPDTPKPRPRLALGEPAPAIAATSPDGKESSLALLHGNDPARPKLIVLQFGSLTDPIFRARAASVDRLASRLADKATFVILYQQESHASDGPDPLTLNHDLGFDITQPVTVAERRQLALQTLDRLNIKNQTMLVDAWNNTTSLRYGSYPNMTFIIDALGNLQAGYPWMDPNKVQAAVDLLSSGKPLTPELKGSVKPSASAPLDFESAAMEMTGGRGPATIALTLDKIKLTDEQRVALYPALAQYLADLQTFRQSMASFNGGRGARGAHGAAAPGGNAGGGGGAPSTTNTPKPTTPEEVQAANDALHTSAAKLKTLIRQSLPPNDATTLLSALEQTQSQRLFATP